MGGHRTYECVMYSTAPAYRVTWCPGTIAVTLPCDNTVHDIASVHIGPLISDMVENPMHELLKMV